MSASALVVWSGVLDDYARSLDDAVGYLRALAGSRGSAVPEPPMPFAPPSSLPPLPRELAERAAALEARTREIAAMTSTDMDRVRPSSQPLARRRPATASHRRSFDTRL